MLSRLLAKLAKLMPWHWFDRDREVEERIKQAQQRFESAIKDIRGGDRKTQPTWPDQTPKPNAMNG